MRRPLPLLLPLFALALSSCAKDDYSHLYQASPLPPGWTSAELAALGRLGPTLLPHGVIVSVWSSHATRVE
ncbi:MAG: hypothetical protein JST92_08150, partial [Deltaproteobacteria bacterium]|nr:hypothetical protein [Deltaproteobacteria bacterium]